MSDKNVIAVHGPAIASLHS